MTLEDGVGHVVAVAEGRIVKLCRCGHSDTKPYCDGTHRRVDFVSRHSWQCRNLERLVNTLELVGEAGRAETVLRPVADLVPKVNNIAAGATSRYDSTPRRVTTPSG